MKILLLPFLLMLESSSGRIDVTRDIEKLIVKNCNIKHNFAVVVVANYALANTSLFARYACSGALVRLHGVLTSAYCYYMNNGTYNSQKRQDITVIAGFEKKYLATAGVIRAFTLYKKHDVNDGLVLLWLDKVLQPTPGVNMIMYASRGQADKCKHAQLVSAIVLDEMKVNEQGMPTTVEVHVLCSGVKVVEKRVCTSRGLLTWISPAYSLCGETKPRGRMDKFHLETDSLVCDQAIGSPLVCDGVVIGFQGMCMTNDEVHTSFIKIDPYLKDLKYFFNILRTDGKNKTTTGKPASSGAYFFDGTWWKMAAGLLLISVNMKVC